MSRGASPKGVCGFPVRLPNSPITRAGKKMSDNIRRTIVRRGLCAVLLVYGAALATTSVAQLAPSSLSTQGRTFPELNTETEVEVGQPMVTASNRRVERTEVMVLKADVTGRGPGTRVTVRAGRMAYAVTTSKGTYYESETPIDLKTFGITQADAKGGWFVPSDPSKPAMLYWRDGASRVEVPAQGIEIEKRVVETVATQSAFSRELVYSGVSQGTVSILYREYKSDLARPAFSQELKYDLRDGNEIGFHGARIRVLKAGNLSIRYIVTKPLTTDN